MPTNCLVLYSGGLDSILACKVLEEQNIKPIALRFVTPFFGFDLLELGDVEVQRTREKYGIELHVIEISGEYMDMITGPPHGYGRYLNPCIDCKILMIKKAISMMGDYNASFVATGEVLGQRPMSQRKDTLRIIERETGAEGVLLRPLSARFLPGTIVEKNNIVKRRLLPAISGRGRKAQIALAEKYGIIDYPAPAGGCVLADRILSERFRKIFAVWPNFSKMDCVAAQVGRHFLLDNGSWFIAGRNQMENSRLEKLACASDILLRPIEIPGPLCIIRYPGSNQALESGARIAARYSRLPPSMTFNVSARRREDGFHKNFAVDRPATDKELDIWRF